MLLRPSAPYVPKNMKLDDLEPEMYSLLSYNLDALVPPDYFIEPPQ